MPFVSIRLNPGIDVESTRQLSESGWNESVCVRFFANLLQKVGGFLHLNEELLVGTATGMHAWSDIAGNRYIAVGTEQWLELFFGGLLYNITPLRSSDDVAVDFTTVISTPTVTIKDVSHGSVAGDWVNVFIPVSIGGLIIQGYYQIQTLIDADNYTITAASNATGSVSHGGAVPLFTTTATSANVTVTLANHGLHAGGTFTVQVDTAVGGTTVDATIYSIVGTPATNTFVITVSGVAASSTSASENGGNARLLYLVHSGPASSYYASTSGGWGVGDWGGGQWGGGSSGGTVLIPLRQWFLDNFGQDLVGNYTGSPLFIWVPPPDTSNVALALDTTNFPSAATPPRQVNVSFVSAPQQMIICLGVDDANSHVYQPLLVRWCDAGNFEDWVATVNNQAGSYYIPSGSMLVGGISAPNFTVIWTDIDMWLMTYLGGTGLSQLVWGFTKVTGGSGLLSARCCAIYQNIVFFASSNGFYAFDGNNIRLIPCPVWDIFWFNLNRTQVGKVNAQVNSWFQEISWAFPSADGTGEVDSRVTYNIRENTWTYDAAVSVMARTAWIDENVYGAPIGTDNSGYLQQHEVSNDADGAPLMSSATSGWFSITEGTLMTFVERMVGDFIATGGTQTVYVTVYVQDWPEDTIRTYGPYAWTADSGPNYSIVRARGRYASIKIESTDLGIFWRVGNLRFMTQQAGRR